MFVLCRVHVTLCRVVLLFGFNVRGTHFFQDRVQKRHVGLLRFDRVREHAIRLVRQQQVDRHLFHAEHHRGLGYVLLYHGPGVYVRLRITFFFFLSSSRTLRTLRTT